MKALLLNLPRILGFISSGNKALQGNLRISDPGFATLFQVVVLSFFSGYRQGIQAQTIEQLCRTLENGEPRWRGFAYEGAAMALALQCQVSLRGKVDRLADFIRISPDYIYTIHVGIGWATARVHFRSQRILDQCDPLLRWLAFDGSGFHDAFSSWRNNPSANLPRVDDVSMGYERRARLQGAGRCLWFAEGGNSSGLARRISRFDRADHGDLWSGVGLAAVYAGGIASASYSLLKEEAGEHWPNLAQGAVFGAAAAHRDGSATPQQDQACQLLTEHSMEEASHLADDCLRAARENPSPSQPAYEEWRKLIQESFRTTFATTPPTSLPN